jgi:hypothetical protein
MVCDSARMECRMRGIGRLFRQFFAGIVANWAPLWSLGSKNFLPKSLCVAKKNRSSSKVVTRVIRMYSLHACANDQNMGKPMRGGCVQFGGTKQKKTEIDSCSQFCCIIASIWLRGHHPACMCMDHRHRGRKSITLTPFWQKKKHTQIYILTFRGQPGPINAQPTT